MSESLSNPSQNHPSTSQQLDIYCGEFFSSENEHAIEFSAPWPSTGSTKQNLVNPLNFIFNEQDPGSSQFRQVEYVEEGLEECNMIVSENNDYQNLLKEEPNFTVTENIEKQLDLVMEYRNQNNSDSNSDSKDKQKRIDIQSVVTITHKKPVYSKDNAVIVEEIYPEENNVKTLMVLNTRQHTATENNDPSKPDTKIKETPIKPSKTKLKAKNTKLVQLEPGQKLYQRIPSPVEEVKEEPGIFDFVDDEDNEDKKRKRQELRELKDRTCSLCSKIFNDPIAVLRHKRQEHNRRKKILDKLELQPYLLKPPQDHCPVCSKRLYHNPKFKSLYVKHLMTHSNILESSLKCKVCERRFKRKDHLENHQRRHL